MPSSPHEILKAFLSVMATTEDASWVLYVAATFQIALLIAGLSKRARRHSILVVLVAISQLILPVLLAVGFYYATKPVA